MRISLAIFFRHAAPPSRRGRLIDSPARSPNCSRFNLSLLLDSSTFIILTVWSRSWLHPHIRRVFSAADSLCLPLPLLAAPLAGGWPGQGRQQPRPLVLGICSTARLFTTLRVLPYLVIQPADFSACPACCPDQAASHRSSHNFTAHHWLPTTSNGDM